MDLPYRSQIRPGMQVLIIEKHNQRSGELTQGVVARILTKSPNPGLNRPRSRGARHARVP
jgi:uncharacterized repeat protein (TIGR03833 family)